MKKKQIKAYLLLDTKGKPLTCRCHPSGRLSYVLYKKKNEDFGDKYWQEIIIPSK